MAKVQRTVVTISRQLASGGAYIGHLVARRLGYKYVEREVLYAAARDLGVNIRDIAAQDEKKSSFLDNLMKSFVFGAPEAVYLPPSRRPVYDEELFAAECKVIREIAAHYDSVIVGHAGFSVLRGQPAVCNVYIHAPAEFRLARLREFHSISEEEALAQLEEADRRREEYLRTRTECRWHDARNYHLCIDSRTAGFETAADMIIMLAEKLRSRV